MSVCLRTRWLKIYTPLLSLNIANSCPEKLVSTVQHFYMSTKGSFAVLQPWTKVIETKVENPVNLKNDSIFQISNSPSHESISILNLARLFFQMPKTLQTILIWLQRGFFAENYIFFFVSAVLSKIAGYWYFLKISRQTAHCCWNACCCTVCFQFNPVQLAKLICMN